MTTESDKKTPCYICELADLRIKLLNTRNPLERNEILDEIDKVMARERIK